VRARARHFSTAGTVARLRELLAGAGLGPSLDSGGGPC
jgi:hypothetical protein